MKKISICLVLNLFFLSSCLPSVELNERAIVEAIGIDKNLDEFVVSVEYYSPNSNIENSVNTTFIKASGKSISSAIAQINSKVNKELYFGHNNIVVVGIEAAEKDINKILQFFDEEPETKSDICIFITEKAEEIIGFDQEKAKFAPLSILEIVEKDFETDKGYEYRLYKLINKTEFVLPFGETTDDFHFKVSGNCLFKSGILFEKRY